MGRNSGYFLLPIFLVSYLIGHSYTLSCRGGRGRYRSHSRTPTCALLSALPYSIPSEVKQCTIAQKLLFIAFIIFFQFKFILLQKVKVWKLAKNSEPVALLNYNLLEGVATSPCREQIKHQLIATNAGFAANIDWSKSIIGHGVWEGPEVAGMWARYTE